MTQKVTNNEYKNTDSYPNDPRFIKEKRKELQRAWSAKTRQLEGQFLADLKQSFLDIGAVEEAALLAAAYSWDSGHSSGLASVLDCAWDIFPILEAQVKDCL